MEPQAKDKSKDKKQKDSKKKSKSKRKYLSQPSSLQLSTSPMPRSSYKLLSSSTGTSLHSTWFAHLCSCSTSVSLIFFIVSLVYGLPYPSGIWSMEFISLMLFAFLQFVKIDIGSKGNKTEKSKITFIFFILTWPCLACFVFFWYLQTYV